MTDGLGARARVRASRARVRAKICGVTSAADASLAAAAGADAIGLNFHPLSPRVVSFERARAIRRVLPPFVAVVGVFVDPDEAVVRNALATTRLDILQFHGSEPAAFCRQFDLPYVKATGFGPGFDFDAWQKDYPDACALLLDSNHGGRAGGTGVAFDWTLWPASDRALILAGGLHPDNVADAVRVTQPFAVDVASGVEGPRKGHKDARKLDAFFAALANA